ncbi:hypothetical protein ACA910_007655 [Epithemia clementina (nom. ined.)]
MSSASSVLQAPAPQANIETASRSSSTTFKQQQQCHRCFGCCATRRAVIVVDVLLLVTGVLALTLEIYGFCIVSGIMVVEGGDNNPEIENHGSKDDFDYTDNNDAAYLANQTNMAQGEVAAYMVLTIVGLLASVLSLFGAMTFQ